ncbi:calpain family cysteine protease containing protein [Stylonychia lemnae]|uniref:Calpain family cysteine protease containing protein n=1 Tax=Stylonychia lemnae TaxID=5949 RepID=A0A078B2H8_STYLE|nr:calpain family cysteine protease containing protein [Stylonychia lemnae]|eukprot:CDW87688.1 calpain family cysteine protease containing protein [Stylonychia lemnae]
MKLSHSALLLLFGVQLVTASQNRLQKMIRSLPQAKQVTQSCTTAIDRFKAALPDYKTIVQSSSNFWSDGQFPADGSSIQWTGTKYSSNGLISYAGNKWERLNNLCPECTLFGTSDYLNDITQGGLGDCYYLAGISAVAEINSRFEKVFVNPQVNWAGLYAFNVYIRGIPHVMVVDDSIPAGQYGKKPVFAGLGGDNSIWGPLLEKAWAKANTNYEQIIGGQPFEAFSFLASVPNNNFKIASLNATSIWTKVSQADGKNWIMSISTPSAPNGDKDKCKFNLACAHAYSLLAVSTVYNADRTQSINLFKIRNPWRKDADYSGSYADGSSLWLSAGADGKTYAQQVGLVIADDGVFYMTSEEVLQSFDDLNIGQYTENFVTSWYDKRDDQVANENTPAIYKFTLNEPTPMYIRSTLYSKRMYPISCKPDQANIKLILEDAFGKQLNYYWSNEQSYSYINLVDAPLNVGTYTLKFYPQWTAVDVKDYGIVIDAPRDIVITDVNGQASRLTAHDFSNKELKAIVAQAPKPEKPKLPDISQTGAAYDLTGNLDQDILKIRYSSSLPITNQRKGTYLTGSSSTLIGGVRYGLAMFMGTLREDITYTSTLTVTTKPGHIFKFSPGNDKCTVTNNGDDEIKCTCLIKPDTYPKECLLVVITKEGEGYSNSYSASAKSS